MLFFTPLSIPVDTAFDHILSLSPAIASLPFSVERSAGSESLLGGRTKRPCSVIAGDVVIASRNSPVSYLGKKLLSVRSALLLELARNGSSRRIMSPKSSRGRTCL